MHLQIISFKSQWLLLFNPDCHELWKQEKCPSLAPRCIFYKTQWAWQDVKLTWLISIFTSKIFLKFLMKIQLTKSDPKRKEKKSPSGQLGLSFPIIFSGQNVDENKKSAPNIEDFAKIATWNLTNAIALWDCSSAICSWRCKSFSSLGLLAKKSPRTKKAHWNKIFFMKHSIHPCFHEKLNDQNVLIMISFQC